MKIIELDASSWTKPTDFYDAVYDALSDPAAMPLPHQFGSSVDALLDVMVFGGMAHVEPPYALHILNLAQVARDVQQEIELVAATVTRQGAELNVSITIVSN